MLGSKHRWLLFCAFLLLMPSRVGGQRAASIEALEVALWPEYDRQGVLVIYRFRLSPGSPTPATVAVPIPATVGQPHAVAWRNAEGGLLVAEYTRIVEDERARMLITMHSLAGQLEFYEDLIGDDKRRSFRFSWPGGVEVGDFSYEVQEPVGALLFEVVPPPDRRVVGQDGLTYQSVDLGPLRATDRPTLELSYEKETAALSVEALAPPPPAAPSTASPQVLADDDAPPLWLLGSFGGLLLGLVVGWYWWSAHKRPEEASSSTQGRRTGKTKPPKKKAAPSGTNFCHNCGAKVVKNATFCMSCGTRLLT